MEIVIYIAAYLIAIIIGHLFVRLLLMKHKQEFSGGLEGAGTIIGILERIFTLTFVLLGEYTAIVIIITAKSIVRFEDFKSNRSFAEYFLIGTLSSILFALLVGIATLYYLSL